MKGSSKTVMVTGPAMWPSMAARQRPKPASTKRWDET